MMSDPEGTILALFAAFCRIGGCIMVLPGFSSFPRARADQAVRRRGDFDGTAATCSGTRSIQMFSLAAASTSPWSGLNC
jgi:hypothetical protein